MNKKQIRLCIFGILNLAVYIGIIYNIYFDFDIIHVFFFSILLVFSIYYFILDLDKRYKNLFVLFLILPGVVVAYFYGFQLWAVISLFILNLGIMVVFSSSYTEISTRKIFMPDKIFAAGLGKLAILLCLSVAVFYAGKNPELNLTCKNLYSLVIKTIDFLPIPNQFTDLDKDTMKQQTKKYLISTPRKLISSGIDLGFQNMGIDDEISGIDSLKSSIERLKNLQKSQNSINKNLFSESNPESGSALRFLDKEYMKNSFIDKLGVPQDYIDKNMCSIGTETVNKYYLNPFVRYYVLIMIGFFTASILRLIFGIAAGINIIVFTFLKLIKLYQIERVVEEVEILK